MHPVSSLSARGLKVQPGALKSVYDVNPGYGGPIIRDRLWWFATARWTAGRELRPEQLSQHELRPGQTSPTLLNATTLTYIPDNE